MESGQVGGKFLKNEEVAWLELIPSPSLTLRFSLFRSDQNLQSHCRSSASSTLCHSLDEDAALFDQVLLVPSGSLKIRRRLWSSTTFSSNWDTPENPRLEIIKNTKNAGRS